LRVLCVAAQYMNQDGNCRLGQDTIAAHLNITRQAVNKHLAVLDGLDILVSHAVKGGILKTYYLDTDFEDARPGQNRVEKRRKAKRAAKRGEPPTPTAPPPAHPPPPASNQGSEPVESPKGGIEVGDRVFHQKFGYGNVVKVDGNKLTAVFQQAGEKKVVDSFVERCAS
jgi:hypothetical protein